MQMFIAIFIASTLVAIMIFSVVGIQEYNEEGKAIVTEIRRDVMVTYEDGETELYEGIEGGIWESGAQLNFKWNDVLIYIPTTAKVELQWVEVEILQNEDRRR